MYLWPSLSVEVARYGITVNTILTGGVLTERLKNLISVRDDSSADYINSLSKQELGNYEKLITIISEYEDEEYIKSELNEYLNYVDNFSL